MFHMSRILSLLSFYYVIDNSLYYVSHKGSPENTHTISGRIKLSSTCTYQAERRSYFLFEAHYPQTCLL